MTPDKRFLVVEPYSGNESAKLDRGALMENVWVLASVWVGLALIATLVAIWFRISTALSEIVVGTVAQLVIGALFVHTLAKVHYEEERNGATC
jgi:hypothetical protein